MIRSKLLPHIYMIYAQVDQMHMACGIHVVLKLSIQTGHLITLLNSCHLEFLSPHATGLTVMLICDSHDHFATVTIILRQLRSYLLDSYDHVADVWFVSYDHITKVSQAHISKTNTQTNKAWHTKLRLMTPLYCMQIREHSIAHKRQNRPRSELTVADVRHLVWS